MKECNILVVSPEGKSYETILGYLNQEKLGTDVLRVDSMGEAISVLKKTEAEILLADVRHSFFNLPVRKKEEDFTPTKGNAKEDLKYIKYYIRNHYNEFLSLSTLANKACLSANYLSSLFKKNEGITLCAYIERVRMEKAAFLVLTEDKMMQDIAWEVGFRHSSYFCRTFRNFYGETPKQYRLRHRKKK